AQLLHKSSTLLFEILVIYPAIKHFLHPTKEKPFTVSTTPKPLTSVHSAKHGEYLASEILHSDFISNFTSDVRRATEAAIVCDVNNHKTTDNDMFGNKSEFVVSYDDGYDDIVVFYRDENEDRIVASDIDDIIPYQLGHEEVDCEDVNCYKIKNDIIDINIISVAYFNVKPLVVIVAIITFLFIL
ncbi:hypothetical protein KSF78_0001145, partial [Schistosoma japonicum]